VLRGEDDAPHRRESLASVAMASSGGIALFKAAAELRDGPLISLANYRRTHRCHIAAHDVALAPLAPHLPLGALGLGRWQRHRLANLSSTTLAFAPSGRAASMPWIASMVSSICSSVIAFTRPLCSNFSSRGTSKAHIFM
jgi:hypothetical protein